MANYQKQLQMVKIAKLEEESQAQSSSDDESKSDSLAKCASLPTTLDASGAPSEPCPGTSSVPMTMLPSGNAMETLHAAEEHIRDAMIHFDRMTHRVKQAS